MRCRIKISYLADGQPTSHGGCIVCTTTRGSLRVPRYPVFYWLSRGDTKQDIFPPGRKRGIPSQGDSIITLTICYWLSEPWHLKLSAWTYLVTHIKYWPGYLTRSRDWFISHDKDIISVITPLILSLGIIPNKTRTLPPREKKKKVSLSFSVHLQR